MKPSTCLVLASVLICSSLKLVADDFYTAPDTAPAVPGSHTVTRTPATPIHELGARNERWTWRNIFYGPLEILAAPVMLFMGPVAGASAGYDVFTDPDDTTPMAPVRGTLGAIGGGLVGLFACPATLCVGVFDTLTLGAFTDGYFFYDVDL